MATSFQNTPSNASGVCWEEIVQSNVNKIKADSTKALTPSDKG
ncbi:hypothetical protein AND4_19587 [Vibrio sp. AND4]|nr:hypothetical protein AND4_19587 [Vibrio sp. AND4]